MLAVSSQRALHPSRQNRSKTRPLSTSSRQDGLPGARLRHLKTWRVGFWVQAVGPLPKFSGKRRPTTFHSSDFGDFGYSMQRVKSSRRRAPSRARLYNSLFPKNRPRKELDFGLL